MQVIEIPHWLESAAAAFVGVVAVLTAEPFSNVLLTSCFLDLARFGRRLIWGSRKTQQAFKSRLILKKLD
jgi:phage gp46-like protein